MSNIIDIFVWYIKIAIICYYYYHIDYLCVLIIDYIHLFMVIWGMVYYCFTHVIDDYYYYH